jgi:hypothetical protein
MDFTEDNINGWNDSLSHAGMSPEKRGQAIALIQMLHATDPNLWNFENCDRLIAGLVQATVNNENIDEILINMAQAANAPVGSPTILKVERYRKTFLYLLAAGVSFATLQTMAPGVISFILDATYALFQQLLTQEGVTNNVIKTAASASPLSASSMAQAISVSGVNMAQVIADSSTNLVTAALNACVDVAKTCASTVSQNYDACLRYGTELLGFAVATRVVPPVVKSVADVASGSADEKIAQWIDNDGPRKVQAAIQNTLADAVENTKRAIGQSIDDMAAINKGLIDPDRAPNRFIGPTINEMINYALQTNVEKFRGDHRAALGELIGDLSQIDFSSSPNDNENPGVLAIMQKYRIGWNENPGFRALIAVWKLATEKPGKIVRASSQQVTGSEDWVAEAALSLKRSDTLPKKFKYREDIEGTQIPHTTKRKVDDNYDDRSLQFTTTEGLTGELLKLYKTDSTIRAAIHDSGAMPDITQNPDLEQAVLDAINSTSTVSSVGNRDAYEINKNAYIDSIRAAIQTFYNPPINEEELEEELGGSRHRSRKSRRYKKRKATLKRRGLKKRRTRKGKKRRYTKKRR